MTSRSSALAGSALMLRTRSIPFMSAESMSMIASPKRALRAAAVRELGERRCAGSRPRRPGCPQLDI